MSESLNIIIPWPPSGNRYWRLFKNRLIISRDAHDYRRALKHLSYTWKKTDLTGRLSAEIIAHPPDKRKRDLDNLLKITMDALAKTGIYDDDSQFDKICIERGTIEKDGTLVVCIKKYELLNV